MFYEEKIINNVLFFRTTPGGRWRLVPNDVLANRIINAEKKVRRLEARIGHASEFLHQGGQDGIDQALQLLDSEHRKESGN